MAEKNREVFDAKIDDKDVKLAVLRPSRKQEDDAQNIYSRRYRDLIEKGDTLIRVQLDKIMRDRNLWDDEKEKEFSKLQKKLTDAGLKLTTGGFKRTEAYKLALDMKRDRNRLLELVSVRNTIDVNTAEAQAENRRFDYLVSVCTVYDKDEKLVFDNIEDYLNKGDEDYSRKAANTLFKLIHNLDLQDSQKKLPENKFLLKFGYVNDSLHLIDNKKRLVNEDGKHVDENGRFIKWLDTDKWVFVDINNNEVDIDGNYVVDSKPFLDDDGEPIVE